MESPAAIVAIAYLLSITMPTVLNIDMNYIVYGIWFIYYLYVTLITYDVNATSCNCNPNTTYKTLTLIIFGLIIVANLILFKMTRNTQDIMIIINLLFIIGTIVFAMFYNDLKEKGCNCPNLQSIELINIVNIITVVIQIVIIYLNY